MLCYLHQFPYSRSPAAWHKDINVTDYWQKCTGLQGNCQVKTKKCGISRFYENVHEMQKLNCYEIVLVLFTLPNEMIRDSASKQWSGQRHKPRDHIKHPILSSNRIENALTNDNIKRPVVGQNYIKSSCASSSQSAQKLKHHLMKQHFV